MRHLLADSMTRYRGLSLHLQATAKVQIFAERSKPEGAPRRTRGGAEVAYKLQPLCAVMLTKRKPPEKSG